MQNRYLELSVKRSISVGLFLLGISGVFAQTTTLKEQRQTSQGAGVEVSAQPYDLLDEPGALWKFTVELTTHSVDLDFDLAASAILSNENGVSVPATSWTGGKGGHHLTGLLGFDSASLLGAKTWKLVISVPGLGERVFLWGDKRDTNK